MSKFLIAFALLFSAQVFATVDGMTEAWIVVQDVQDEEAFTVMKVPVIGCYGVAQGPQLAQFTAPHKVKATMGCGDSDTSTVDINALSCGVVESAEEVDPGFTGFKKIVLNISKCPNVFKENKQFITMIRTAAARNFPQYKKNGKVDKTREVELIIKK